MHDPRWSEIERELRREEPPDEAAVARIVAAVRRHRPGPARRAWRWLTRARLVRLTPLWALGAAAVVAALLPVAGWMAARRSGDAGARPVQFVLVAPEAARVTVAGDFNDWDPDATPLRRGARDGVWVVVVPLRSGRYRYAFLVDGTRWVLDATAPLGPEDDLGPSSVVLVGGST